MQIRVAGTIVRSLPAVFCAVCLAYSSPAREWSFTLGPASATPNCAGVPHFIYHPDGHISVLKESDGSYTAYWSEFETFRTVGPTPFLEDHCTLSPQNYVIGGRYEDLYPENPFGTFETTFDNGGLWLMGVHRLSGDSLIGIYHAEFHSELWGAPWKSIAVCYSYDNGVSWEADRPHNLILTSSTPAPYPSHHGGVGDCCVIWDDANDRWICYFQEHYLHMAASYDRRGAPGTWLKWHNGEFSEPGLGGEQTPIEGLMSNAGANCSVHWNTYLEKWVIAWHGWAPRNSYISTSEDAVHWEEPRLLIQAPAIENGNAWYPNIIGETDVLVGSTARLYYAENIGAGEHAGTGHRTFKGMDITFSRPDVVAVGGSRGHGQVFASGNPLQDATVRADRNGVLHLSLSRKLNSSARVKIFTARGRLAGVWGLQAGATGLALGAPFRAGGAYLVQVEHAGKTYHERCILPPR